MQLLSLVLFHLITGLTAGQSFSSEGFDNPPDGVEDLSYPLGQLIQVTWHSNLERIALTLWHTGGDDYEYLPDSGNVTNVNSYPWVVGSTKNISNNTFYFLIYKPGDTAPSLRSNTFVITGATTTSVTTSTTTTSSSSTSSTASTPTVSGSPTFTSSPVSPGQTVTPTTSAVPSAGLSPSAKTGLGIGIGIGVPLLVALGALIGWRLRAGRQKPESSREGYTAVGTPFKGVVNSTPEYSTTHELEESRPNMRSELPSEVVHEMGSNPRR